jgi:predicted PurR-regulated permease PerM
MGTYRRLAKRTRRPVLVAASATMVLTAVVAGTIVTMMSLLVLQGVRVLSGAPQWFAPDGAAALLVQRLVTPLAAFLRLEPEDVVEKVRGALGGIATSMASLAAHMVGVAIDGVLGTFFMAITMYFVFLHWTEISRRAEHFLPINPHHTRHLMREIRTIGRTVVVGNFGTAIVQGTIAGVGYAIGGVPQPAFLGAVTAVASLVPVFGTLLVWVPAGLLLLVAGHPGRGVFELIWGSLAVVAFCDYVVRPRLVGGAVTTSTWMTFVALFGGIKLFGAVGFLFGPLLVGIAAAVLRLYERTRRFRLGLS